VGLLKAKARSRAIAAIIIDGKKSTVKIRKAP
jgi:hypothetical protein